MNLGFVKDLQSSKLNKYKKIQNEKMGKLDTREEKKSGEDIFMQTYNSQAKKTQKINLQNELQSIEKKNYLSKFAIFKLKLFKK